MLTWEVALKMEESFLKLVESCEKLTPLCKSIYGEGMSSEMAELMITKGVANLQLKEYDQAINYLTKAVKYLEKEGEIE